jgi:hypothetical protein
MRALVTKDVFTMSRIITKMNVKDELRQIATRDEKATTLDMGIEMVLTVMSKVSDKSVEREIYVFVADVMGRTPEEIENGDPLEIIDSITKDNGVQQWKDFFSKVSKLIFGR